MGKRFSPTLVGIFVLGAVALAVAGVAVFGSGRFFRNTQKFVVFFDGSVNGLRVGAPVKFKGVQVGDVADIRLSLGPDFIDQMTIPRIPVVIEIDNDQIREHGGIGIKGNDRLKQLIDRGLRAQLNSESYVTGLLYIALDAFPDDPPRYVGGDNLPYPELPTVPTTFEQAQSLAQEIIDKLKEMKLEEMIADLRDAADGVNKLVNSEGLKNGVDSFGEVMASANKALTDVSSALARVESLGGNLDKSVVTVQKDLASTTIEARRMLEQATASLENVGTLTRPDAPLAQQLGSTLKDVSRASQQLSNFLDYLERNPSALVRGKGAPEAKPETKKEEK